MSFNIWRTTVGDRLAAIASVLLVIDLFARPWFAYKPQFHATAAMLGQRVSANGWQSFEAVGPLTLVVCAVAIAIPAWARPDARRRCRWCSRRCCCRSPWRS